MNKRVTTIFSNRSLAEMLYFAVGDKPEVTSWQTLAVSKIADAAERSARTGKTIDIDWSKDDIPAVYS